MTNVDLVNQLITIEQQLLLILQFYIIRLERSINIQNDYVQRKHEIKTLPSNYQFLCYYYNPSLCNNINP